MEFSNSDLLCGNYLCNTTFSSIWTTNLLKNNDSLCNGIPDCTNTNLDETGCSETNMTELKSGKKVPSDTICDDICDKHDCEDEASCNNFAYGLYCDHEAYEEPVNYRQPTGLCRGENYTFCSEGEDSANCAITSETQTTCTHRYSKETVPVLNITRCAAFFNDWSRYCGDFAWDQTNCSDSARVGVSCLVKGYMSTVSKYMICYGEKTCDDNIENNCFNPSKTCSVHKHRMCDGNTDCDDSSDETQLICNATTRRKCRRRVGLDKELSLPLAWLGDGVRDCINGSDEIPGPIWPTCGQGKTKRFVTSNEDCENVFLCPWGDPGFVELGYLCDGVESCGNENEICSERLSSSLISTTVLTTDRSLTKRLSYCLKGLSELHNLTGGCVNEDFIFPNHDFFGVKAKTALIYPNKSENCDHMFGEQYVYTSCTDRCANSICPLRNIPRYEVCPDQYPARIGTIAKHEYLAFFTKSFGDVYTNRYFVCDNKIKCIDYAQVCDLVDDCGDGSDERTCTNHFECNDTGRYIPKTSQCDGKVDCMDLSDECNDQCSRQILESNTLKVASWTIGSLAILANLIVIINNLGNLGNCKSSVVLVNKSLIILISFGDILVGCYLFAISIYDGIIFKKSYCKEQIKWITSYQCSTMGVLSTIGTQVSLFAMTALSICRLYVVWDVKRTHGKVTNKRRVQILGATVFLTIASVAIAIIPIIDNFEDYFVNGVKFADDLMIFIGTVDKKRVLAVLEAYHGRMKETSSSWKMIKEMVREMFSRDLKYEDYTDTKRIETVGFYGNDGVCLFKYFVHTDDPQKLFVWSILTLNFACFFIIAASYLIISVLSHKATEKSGNARAGSRRDNKTDRRIAIIITSDFFCWVPFIIICVLHSLEVLDATPWYSLFSIIILPINSFMNPLILDDAVKDMMRVPVLRVSNIVRSSAVYQWWLRRTRVPTIRRIDTDVELREIGVTE